MAAKLDIKQPFRIIGVQILDGTDTSVRKVLSSGWYPLIKCKENIGISTEKYPEVDADVCPLHYYRQNGVSLPTVTISAIVGKNGSGKTTLVDIIYRILNNFAETLLTPIGSDHCDAVLHACGVHARLFFELDGILKFIECDDYATSYFEVINGQSIPIIIKGLSEAKVKDIFKGFFYTISINYSLYAFNPTDYESVFHNRNYKLYDAKWIDRLFHKNDGYFVPIVLTPFREDGQIDINNENDLAEQRLSTLSLLFHSQDREFLEDYTPEKLQYAFNFNYKDEKKNRMMEQPLIPELSSIQLLLIQHLQEAWIKILEDEAKLVLEPEKNPKHEVASFYLAYKTLKICALYPDYKDNIPFDLFKTFRENVNGEDNNGNISIRKDRSGQCMTMVSPAMCSNWMNHNTNTFVRVAHILYNSSINHITAKIHQTISYLHGGKYDKDSDILDVNENVLCKNRYESYDDVMMLLPPPFFSSELQFKKKGADEEDALVSFPQMSSGERQIYYSLSYVFYHIRNIAGIKENGKRTVGYHHINLIFDEAELYYHPEYQRKFVSKLLSGLTLCHINRNVIRSINLILITHSPFILSDIPDTNILFLTKGKDINMNIKTLGANVYDLLAGGFFLDYAIGDFIHEKLQTYLSIYHDTSANRKERFQEIRDEMKYVVSHLGEQYLHDTFLRMFNEMDIPEDNEGIRAKIQELQRQQRLLENELKDYDKS